ncbi:hypothetical protein AB7C87_08865 [Natrarchaeobius sp. A-rgal3]|uniref:hypothetical protein n=1 Tax=Natrarchaeobius versutus TaxID=1679078 RepID=UPI0035104F01
MKIRRSPGGRRERRIRKAGQLLLFVLAIGLIVLSATERVDLTWPAIALFAIVLVVVILNDLEQLEVGEFGSIHLREDIDRAKRRVDALEDRPATGGSTDGADDRSPVEALEVETRNARDETRRDETRGTDSERAKGTTLSGSQGEGDEASSASEDPSEIATRLYELLAADPQYALVELRVELERALEQVDEAVDAPGDVQPTAGRTADLAELVAAHEEVVGVCDRAIRGEDRLERDEAARVIELGLRVLEYVRCRTRASVEARPRGESR